LSPPIVATLLQGRIESLQMIVEGRAYFTSSLMIESFQKIFGPSRRRQELHLPAKDCEKIDLQHYNSVAIACQYLGTLPVCQAQGIGNHGNLHIAFITNSP